MKCEYHLDNGRCQLGGMCKGEDRCGLYQLDASRVCPSCNGKGAGWSGYGKPGGFKYTCWSCGHTWTELGISRPETPGVCLRCGREFENPVPPVVNPEGGREIATSEFCADCNKLIMSVVFRDATAYRVPGTRETLHDPIRGGKVR